MSPRGDASNHVRLIRDAPVSFDREEGVRHIIIPREIFWGPLPSWEGYHARADGRSRVLISMTDEDVAEAVVTFLVERGRNRAQKADIREAILRKLATPEEWLEAERVCAAVKATTNGARA